MVTVVASYFRESLVTLDLRFRLANETLDANFSRGIISGLRCLRSSWVKALMLLFDDWEFDGY